MEGALTAFQDSKEAIAAASLLVHPQLDAALAVRVNKYLYPLLVLSNVKCSAPMIMNPKLSLGMEGGLRCVCSCVIDTGICCVAV